MTVKRRECSFDVSSKLQMVKLSRLTGIRRVSVFEHIKWTDEHES